MGTQTLQYHSRWVRALAHLVVTVLAIMAVAAGVLVLLCIINLIGHVVVDISHL
jgi:hypothetical protein